MIGGWDQKGPEKRKAGENLRLKISEALLEDEQ